MEHVRLKDVCTLINGRAYKQEELLSNGKYPVLRVGNFFSDKDFYYSDLELDEDKYCDNGDLLFAWSASFGPKIWTGEKVIYHYHIWKMVLSDRVDKEYLYYYLLYLSERIKAEGHGGIMIHTTKAEMEEREILLPSLEQQKEFVCILNRMQTIIQNRKLEVQKLDDLIKARFVEMFGDIKTNEYNWPHCTFKDVSIKITDGEHGTVPRVDENDGYLYFMARNITKDGDIDLSETSFVPAEIHKKIYKRCNPERDDLLLVCVGATIGKCTLVPEELGEFSMARSVALIKPDREKVTSGFLINLLRSEAIQSDIDHCSHAAAQAGLYTNMINNLDAFVPPMELQTEFDSFCKQVDKSKVAVQKSLDETQILFESLMQKYFG